MEIFPAHIRIEKHQNGTRCIIQEAQIHCRNTAVYAGNTLLPIGLNKTGYLAGLTHDCGKFKAKAREYLEKAAKNEPVAKGSVNHTFAAVRMLLERYHGEQPDRYEDIVCELLAYAVGAHHGMFDCIDKHGNNGFDHRKYDETIDYDETIQNYTTLCADFSELDALFQASVTEMVPILEQLNDLAASQEELSFYIGLLARLLASAVMEGDRRDTAEFMRHMEYPAIISTSEAFWKEYLDHVEKKLSQLPANTKIQQARCEISRRCREAADGEAGIFRLTVPTGGGKTLCSLRYALAHAAKWGKRRIFFIMPLLAIIEQNAAVIREYVQDDTIILEHHSNLVQTEAAAEEELDVHELLAESYGSAIIITTLVQFLNTLFMGKTTSVRRFQSLCDSVIVIDEVQTVPVKLLSQFNLAINFLTEVCHATIILCSATQPCLEKAAHPIQAVQEMIAEDLTQWPVFQRTRVKNCGSFRLEELADFARDILKEADSLLIVCNTKSEARKLYHYLEGVPAARFHLSASMCMEHRRQTMAALEASIAGKGKTVCVSTQVMEAGVDISFQRVVRLSAGMDNVVQAAGRCNRHGECALAPVYLVRCMDEDLRFLPDIQAAQNATEEMLAQFEACPTAFQNDLTSELAISCYYQEFFRALNRREGSQDFFIKDERYTLFDLLSDNRCFVSRASGNLDGYYLKQGFKTAGQKFEVFENNTVDILVPYGEGAEIMAALASQRVEHDWAYAGTLLKRAKRFSISIFEYERQKLEQQHAIIFYSKIGILALQPDCYDEETGLSYEGNGFKLLEV